MLHSTLKGSSVSAIRREQNKTAMAGEADSMAFPPSSLQAPTTLPVAKKKRNLPGTPDPEAEVISLSPKALMATNRFLCEICGKGFQRDQNLQLHRRGHNLPWKLGQRSGKEARKRVYVCPEKSCVHHNPARALGDLTGIKKQFCRKHGEKKWKCDKCARRYAVQSDWKAHAKVCGTREYRCDCGSVFSRRDSFITHRAFCDALAEEAARISAASVLGDPVSIGNACSYPSFATTPASFQQPLPALDLPPWRNQGMIETMAPQAFSPFAEQLESQLSWIYNEGKLPTQSSGDPCINSHPACMPLLPSSAQLENRRPPDMSATALLQKAAEMGVVLSGSPSLLAGFDIRPSFGVQREGGGEITRDFLGVGVQALCPASVRGWI